MGSFWLASRLLLHLNYNSFLSLQPISLHHQILASPSLCKHMSQVLEKSLLYVTTSYWFSSSGECGVLQEVQKRSCCTFSVLFLNSPSHRPDESFSLSQQPGDTEKQGSDCILTLFSWTGGMWKHSKSWMCLFPTPGETQTQFNLSYSQQPHTYFPHFDLCIYLSASRLNRELLIFASLATLTYSASESQPRHQVQGSKCRLWFRQSWFQTTGVST